MNTFKQVKEKANRIPFKKSSTIALVGGAMSSILTLTFFVGLRGIFRELSFYGLLAAMQNSSTTLCFAGIAAASTIMPLMLTIFSFARNSTHEFSQSFYRRIKWIALFCIVAFFSGLLTLTILSSPVQEVENVGPIWYQVVYYAVIAGLTTMVGTLGSIIILLYYSILHIINSLDPQKMRQEEQDRKDEKDRKDKQDRPA